MDLARPKILYILSSGRSGSTLIDMVLGGNSGLVSVGEFHRLSLYARSGELCTCGALVPECSFWKSVAKAACPLFEDRDAEARILQTREVMLGAQGTNHIRNVAQLMLLSVSFSVPWSAAQIMIGRHDANAINNAWTFLQAIRNVTNCRVIVESTKDVRRMKLYYLSAPKQTRVLHLTRDGRAVAASAMRRTGCSMREAAEIWKKKNMRISVGLGGVPAHAIHRLRYEDFCAAPHKSVSGILAFLELPEDSPSIELKKAERHNIAGNPMRFELEMNRISLDDRWKEQLSKADFAEFAKVAGPLNQSLGYPE